MIMARSDDRSGGQTEKLQIANRTFRLKRPQICKICIEIDCTYEANNLEHRRENLGTVEAFIAVR